MSDQQLKKKFGWTANSKELATYAHLRLEDLDNSFRGHYGLASTEKQPEFLMKPCPACHTQNKPHEQFCNKCKRPLALRDVLQEQERDRALEELTVELLTLLASENPQVKERFRALVERKNLQKVFDVTNPV